MIAAGGRVDQKCNAWQGKSGPLRIWLKKQNLPGLMVSRSLGDAGRLDTRQKACLGLLPRPQMWPEMLISESAWWSGTQSFLIRAEL